MSFILRLFFKGIDKLEEVIELSEHSSPVSLCLLWSMKILFLVRQLDQMLRTIKKDLQRQQTRGRSLNVHKQMKVSEEAAKDKHVVYLEVVGGVNEVLELRFSIKSISQFSGNIND